MPQPRQQTNVALLVFVRCGSARFRGTAPHVSFLRCSHRDALQCSVQVSLLAVQFSGLGLHCTAQCSAASKRSAAGWSRPSLRPAWALRYANLGTLNEVLPHLPND
jgi:hypothetical protein